VDRAADNTPEGIVTRRGAPRGAFAAAAQDDHTKNIALQEGKLFVGAALRLHAHGLASGEIFPNDLSEAVMRLLGRADDWLAVAGASDA
jgi:hypothetical protein